MWCLYKFYDFESWQKVMQIKSLDKAKANSQAENSQSNSVSGSFDRQMDKAYDKYKYESNTSINHAPHDQLSKESSLIFNNTLNKIDPSIACKDLIQKNTAHNSSQAHYESSMSLLDVEKSKVNLHF